MVSCFECLGAAIASIVGLSAAISAAVQDRVRSVNANYFLDRRQRQAQDIQGAYARASAASGSQLGSVKSHLSGFSAHSVSY